jgi:hypothetical protein
MAKRKAARAAKKAKNAAPKKAGTQKAARKAAPRKIASKKAPAKAKAKATAKKSAAAPARKAAPKRRGAKSARPSGRKTVQETASRRPTAGKGGTGRTASAKSAASRPAAAKTAAGRPGAAKRRRQIKPAASPAERKAPSLDRARRVVMDDEIVSSPPSTLDMDRTASAARSGRKALHDRLEQHHETGPGMTGGDVDADWESAYSVGDEAPGGDNPTPDQDIVDEIGRALGNEYQDNEPLKGADKISARDKHRWELDPGSKEDFDDREDVDPVIEGSEDTEDDDL